MEQQTQTKITTASIRIALAFQYSTFEVSLNLDNPNGILKSEIELARIDCQSLANNALNEYKALPSQNPKEELKKIENKVAQLKELVNGKQPEKEPDPKEIAEIEKLPLYQPKQAKVKKAKS